MNRDTETIAINMSDLLESVVENSTFDDYLDIQNFNERKIYLNDEINDFTVEPACRAIFRYNTEDKGKPVEDRNPIKIYLNTCGGSASAGFELIDAMLVSKTPVWIVVLGCSYSMGFIITLAAHRRFGMKNASYLLHDGSRGACDSASKTRDLMEFCDRLDDRIKDFVLDRTNITDELYDVNMRKEWYMFSDEAKGLGVITDIIGEDCELDEVI